MKTLRIVLADDHTLVRAGIRALLAGIPGAEVVGEAEDAPQAIELADALAPDVMLIDISMGATSGLQVLDAVRARHPAAQCIILSMHAEGEYVAQALRAGAAGYLLKDAAPAELEIALRAVARGETYLSPAVSKQLVDNWMRPPADASAGAPQAMSSSPDKATGPAPAPGTQALTPRQLDILRRIAEGQSTKEIAWQLDLSVKTVETHRAQIMERLGIRDVPGLTRYAVRTGLVSADR